MENVSVLYCYITTLCSGGYMLGMELFLFEEGWVMLSM
jgi:hypothetical protein